MNQPQPDPVVLRLAGRRGWIRQYVEWARTQTAAYEEYHLGTAIAILSGALGHNVRFWAWQKEFTPNLYCLLLGPSGSKKSHALGFGKEAYKRATGDQPLPTQITKAALIQQFKGDPLEGIEPRKSAMWFHSELAVFLSTLNQEFNAGLRETLTALYDGDEISSGTVSKGLTVIKPSLSILAASNVEWLVKSISASDVMGGFLPRWTFFPGATKGDEPDEFWSPPTQYSSLSQGLEYIVNPVTFGGPNYVDYGPSREIMRDWMGEHRKLVADAVKSNPQLVPFYERWETLFIKLCVIYQVSLDASLNISADAVACAAELATYLRVRFESLVLDNLAFDRRSQAQVALRQYIERNGVVNRKTLKRVLRSHFPTMRDLELATEALLGSGDIEYVQNTSGEPAFQISYQSDLDTWPRYPTSTTP